MSYYNKNKRIDASGAHAQRGMVCVWAATAAQESMINEVQARVGFYSHVFLEHKLQNDSLFSSYS